MDVFSGTRRPDEDIDPGYAPTYLLYTVAALLVVATATRIITSLNTQPKRITTQDGRTARTVPKVPYYLPLLGHIPSLAWNATDFTTSLRTKYSSGIFALNLGGKWHNIISSPALSTALLNQSPHNASFEDVGHKMLVRVFGLPVSEQNVWALAFGELTGCYKYLLTEPSLGQMLAGTVRRLKENVVNLVSFTESLVDQTLWERVANVRVATNGKGEEVVEASLFPLVREIVAHAAVPAIMGSNFLAKFPDFFDNLWTFDRAFLLLGMGLPRWTPIPLLTRAHIAQRKMLDQLMEFHKAMENEANGEDPGADWRDLDDVSTLIKERFKLYRKYGLSMTARAGCEEVLLWAASANSNSLIFWMLNRIYADQDLLRRVREEIAPYVKAVQPKQEFPVPEAPRFDAFDMEALCSRCLLLKSCYVECLRLDAATWSLKVVQQDFALQSREKGAERWLLRKGEYANVAHDLHNTNPQYFADPLDWKADRHIKYEGDEKTASVDLGSLRPYGGGVSMCKGRTFAFRECMVFAAAIVSMWDIEAAGGGEWKMPRHQKATGVFSTSDNTRVWIKHRVLPQAS